MRRSRTGGSGKARKATREHVRIVDRGPNRCALCGGRIGKSDDRVMLGSHSAYAHMRCVIKYSFSTMRHEGAGDREGVVKARRGAGRAPAPRREGY